tara:strand:- start:313 stop:456 length:144 start_codon:yes stop_codon:yes gene_type:complete
MALTDKKKKQMIEINQRRVNRIMKATNNGRAWWIYQQLTAPRAKQGS